MKKIRKKNVLAVVGAVIVALCFCSLSFLVPKERVTKASAEGEGLTPTLRFEYGFNVLDPSIWDFSGLTELGMAVTEDTSSPFGGVYQISSTVLSSYRVLIGRYDKPSDLSQSVSETRPDFYCVQINGSLPYRIAVSFPELGADLTTTAGAVTYLPPPSIWTYCEFYFLSSSDNQGEVFSMQFAPCMSIIGSLYGRNSTYWQPFIENVSGGASPEELEQARNEGYLEGLQYGKAGYFNDILIEYEVITSGGSLGGNSIKPEVLYDGISLVPLYQDLYAYTQLPGASTIQQVRWWIYFSKPVPFSVFRFGMISTTDYALSANGEQVRYSVEVETDDRSTYYLAGRFNSVANKVGYRLSISAGPDFEYMPEELFNSYAYSIRAIQGFVTYDINDFLSLQFIGDGSSSFTAGYDSGYNKAQTDFIDQKESIRAEGFNSGIEQGKLIGFDNGFAEGFAQASSDDPYNLNSFIFTFLDMPGRILYNWLNFEFMGINLAGLLALLVSALLIAYVWKKVT